MLISYFHFRSLITLTSACFPFCLPPPPCQPLSLLQFYLYKALVETNEPTQTPYILVLHASYNFSCEYKHMRNDTDQKKK